MGVAIEFRDYSLWFDGEQVLKRINLTIPANAVTAVFGPAGSGQSGVLRTINRMAEIDARQRHEGDVLLDGSSIFDDDVDVPALRRRAVMVFAQPVPLPMSIYENVTYGLRLQKRRERKSLDAIAERALRGATLWDEVKDRLDASGMALSGGQQQRLSIARALALDPEVMLLDAPTAALDPVSTAKIEDMIATLKASYTIVIVPHSVQQAMRLADIGAFFLGGECVEVGPRSAVLVNPKDPRTESYVTGRFG